MSVGRRFGRYSVLGNLVYGQDPEGHERDGEIRAAALGALGRWTLGLDSRFRFAIGSQQTAMARAEPSFDLFGGPVAGAVVGSADWIKRITHRLNHLGGSLDPHACFLLDRGLKTLVVRVRHQNQSALQIAGRLERIEAALTDRPSGQAANP